jgi:hypothetical protein
MEENRELGIWIFKGDEEDIAARWMWTCLMDLSWCGYFETIFRIMFKKPPKWVFKE